MPIDPSIIGNVMAPQAVQMPDVNAMMQTQTRGMENIYQIEAAREAQAKEAAKAQEDAAVKALLPAYAHAFKTGDLRGALKFAPPQYQEGLLPYIEALDGKPLEEIQAALTGSLVTSDVGRAFLENQARVSTLGVQQGQLDVSREDLALRRQKQALDARGPQMTPYQTEMIKLAKDKDAREAAKVSPEAAKQKQAVREIDTAIAKISEVAQPGNLIDMSTNSIIGNLLDEVVAQTSGGLITLPGDVAAAQMEVIAHLARMAVPRFEGPQGEKDAAIYERASGQLSSPTTSNTTKRAAAQTVVELLNARRDQFEFSGADSSGGADSGVLEYDEDGNLIE